MTEKTEKVVSKHIEFENKKMLETIGELVKKLNLIGLIYDSETATYNLEYHQALDQNSLNINLDKMLCNLDIFLDKNKDIYSLNNSTNNPDGYVLIKKEYEKAALDILNEKEFLNTDGIHVRQPYNVKKLKDAGVLEIWFKPVFDRNYN